MTGPVAPQGGSARPVVQLQSVLYGNEFAAVTKAVDCFARAVELAVADGACGGARLRYGDSSPDPCLSPEEVDRLRAIAGPLVEVDYDFFGGNLGSAKGHNRLAAGTNADYLLIANPDVIASPRAVGLLLACFADPLVGMAEAKQLPIEHPKDYDPETGETDWATTAYALIPVPLFERLGGFDDRSFFLYCDDVDFSWLVRAAGRKVIFQPAAVVFHDKRLSAQGKWQPSEAEKYYSAEATLFLAHKWSRPDIVEANLKLYAHAEDPTLARAAASFVGKRDRGELVTPVDGEHAIGVFREGMYARHRFAL